MNWQTLVAELLLTLQQKDQLFALNSRYPTYDSWNTRYVNNPDRWRTDRYYEIERILGPTKYTKFKNKYYKGQNPVAVYNRNKNNYKPHTKGNKNVHVVKAHGGKAHANGKGHGKGKNK